MLDAFKRSSASRITAVLPYYGYARQDRKDKPRVPISAKLVADLLSAAGTDRVLTMDLHASQIQGFFNVPVDHLFAAPVIIDYVARLKLPKLTIVSPDAGGVERARAYAKRLEATPRHRRQAARQPQRGGGPPRGRRRRGPHGADRRRHRRHRGHPGQGGRGPQGGGRPRGAGLLARTRVLSGPAMERSRRARCPSSSSPTPSRWRRRSGDPGRSSCSRSPS